MLSHWFDPRSIHLSLSLLRSRPQISRDGGVSVQAHSHMLSPSSALNRVLGLLHAGYLWAGTCSCSLPRISMLFGLDTLFCLASLAPTRNLFSQGQILSTCEKNLQLLWCRISSLVRTSSLSRFRSGFLFLLSSWTQAGLPSLPLLLELKRKGLQAHLYMVSTVTKRCVLFKSQDMGSL